MKLLFNNSDEIKKYLPYVDADINFENIILDAEDATRKVIKLIGKDLYDKIYSYYFDFTSDESEMQLIKAVAYPIAVDAYRVYVVNNDVAHTNNGRRMRVDDHEKQAFEWQIDRDNKQLERRYYNALDQMIEVLDEINPLIHEANEEDEEPKDIHWKDTEEYQSTYSPLFRTTDEFNEYFMIESRFLLMKLIPGINKCLNEEIIPRFTAQRWKEFQNQLKSNQPLTELELLRFVKAACAYYALSWASTRLSATIFPEGVLQHIYGERNSTQSKAVPTTNQFGVLKTAFDNDFKAAIAKVENYLQPIVEHDPNASIVYGNDVSSDDKILDM